MERGKREEGGVLTPPLGGRVIGVTGSGPTRHLEAQRERTVTLAVLSGAMLVSGGKDRGVSEEAELPPVTVRILQVTFTVQELGSQGRSPFSLGEHASAGDRLDVPGSRAARGVSLNHSYS